MAGLKTEVTGVVVPSSAQVGAAVSVQVKIKNTTDSPLTIMAGGALEYGVTPWPAINFTDGPAEVAAGETHTFSGSFTMPQSSLCAIDGPCFVNVHGYSYYYDETEEAWYPDDEKTNAVTVVEAPSILSLVLPLMLVTVMMVMVMKQFD